MKKFHFLLKIAACIIIQALLLTQVEFSLAYQSNEFNQNRELAYKFRYNIASLSTNLLCAQSFITGLISTALDLRTSLMLLMSFQGMSGKICCAVSKGIYKVFVDCQNELVIKNRFVTSIFNNGYALNKLAEVQTEDATGPPAKEKSDLARVDIVTELLA